MPDLRDAPRVRRVAALLILLVLILLPTALSDHVYSHRYVVYGRVVDAEGRGVPEMRVAMTLSDPPEGNCTAQPGSETDAFGATRTRSITDANGSFVFCLHLHTLDRGAPPTAWLSVEGTDVSSSWVIDAQMRADLRTLLMPNAAGAEGPFIVAGRAWSPSASGSVVVEAIRVYGTTVNGAPVDIAVESGEATVHIATRTNNYGDFAVALADAPAEGARIRVTVANETFDATRERGWATVKARVGEQPPVATTPPAGATPSGASAEPAPTATRKTPDAGIVATLVAACVVAALPARRQRL